MGDATDESDQKTNFPVIEAGSLMRLVIGDASTENNEDKETKECKVLFKDCVFFLSREVNAYSTLLTTLKIISACIQYDYYYITVYVKIVFFMFPL